MKEEKKGRKKKTSFGVLSASKPKRRGGEREKRTLISSERYASAAP